MGFILFWFVCAVITGIVGEGKGRSAVGWFLIGLIFGIFGVILVALLPAIAPEPERQSQHYVEPSSPGLRVKPIVNAVPPKPPVTNEPARVACPECAEMIMPNAKKCRFCGSAIRPA